MLVYGKWKRGTDIGNIMMALTGIAMLVFASTCFKEIPFVGTVFLMPGESILKARTTDAIFRDASFLIGGIFTALGIQLQVMDWLRNR